MLQTSSWPELLWGPWPSRIRASCSWDPGAWSRSVLYHPSICHKGHTPFLTFPAESDDAALQGIYLPMQSHEAAAAAVARALAMHAAAHAPGAGTATTIAAAAAATAAASPAALQYSAPAAAFSPAPHASLHGGVHSFSPTARSFTLSPRSSTRLSGTALGPTSSFQRTHSCTNGSRAGSGAGMVTMMGGDRATFPVARAAGGPFAGYSPRGTGHGHGIGTRTSDPLLAGCRTMPRSYGGGGGGMVGNHSGHYDFSTEPSSGGGFPGACGGYYDASPRASASRPASLNRRASDLTSRAACLLSITGSLLKGLPDPAHGSPRASALMDALAQPRTPTTGGGAAEAAHSSGSFSHSCSRGIRRNASSLAGGLNSMELPSRSQGLTR